MRAHEQDKHLATCNIELTIKQVCIECNSEGTCHEILRLFLPIKPPLKCSTVDFPYEFHFHRNRITLSSDVFRFPTTRCIHV